MRAIQIFDALLKVTKLMKFTRNDFSLDSEVYVMLKLNYLVKLLQLIKPHFQSKKLV